MVNTECKNLYIILIILYQNNKIDLEIRSKSVLKFISNIFYIINEKA